MPYVESHAKFRSRKINPHIQDIVSTVLGVEKEDVVVDNHKAYWGKDAAPITLHVVARAMRLNDELSISTETPEDFSPENAAAYQIAKLLKKCFRRGGEPEVTIEIKPDLAIHFPDSNSETNHS